jgi:hypothetical protein
MPIPSRATYRLVAGGFTALCVAVQYGLLVHGEGGANAVALSIEFFSFFTILTNIIAALALLLPVLAPRSAAAAFLLQPTVRTAIAGYMIMVGVVYYLLLLGVSGRQGWSLFFEHLLHVATPPLFVLDWLAFVDKRTVDWRVGLRALGYPLAYVGYTLVRGAATGWYPYPFLDVADLGYARVALNIGALVGAYILLVAVMAAIGRRLSPIAE